MAIDEEVVAETRLGRRDELAEGVVIGSIELLDAGERVGKAQLAGIDVFAGGDDPRYRAEPDLDARRGDVDEIRQRLLEHRRIELVRLAIDVEIGTREAGAQQRRAKCRAGGEDL